MPAHKTSDGRWRIRLDLGVDPITGRWVRKKVEAKTKRQAESKSTALRERFDRGENIDEKPRTLSELLRYSRLGGVGFGGGATPPNPTLPNCQVARSLV